MNSYSSLETAAALRKMLLLKKKMLLEAQGKISPYFLLEQASFRVEDHIKFLLGPEVLLCPQKLNYRETGTIPTAWAQMTTTLWGEGGMYFETASC